MTRRGLIALALAASLLHLSSIRANSVCIEHSRASAPAHHGEVDHGSDDASATQEDSCDAAAVPQCCQMMAACSAVLAMHVVAHVDRDMLAHAGGVATFDAAPASRITSPDPPPPKS